jgi:hypothetical protein
VGQCYNPLLWVLGWDSSGRDEHVAEAATGPCFHTMASGAVATQSRHIALWIQVQAGIITRAQQGYSIFRAHTSEKYWGRETGGRLVPEECEEKQSDGGTPQFGIMLSEFEMMEHALCSMWIWGVRFQVAGNMKINILLLPANVNSVFPYLTEDIAVQRG